MKQIYKHLGGVGALEYLYWTKLESPLELKTNLSKTHLCETLQQLVSKAVRKRVCEKQVIELQCYALFSTQHVQWSLQLHHTTSETLEHCCGLCVFLESLESESSSDSTSCFSTFAVFHAHIHQVTDCMLTSLGSTLQSLWKSLLPSSDLPVAQEKLNSVICLSVVLFWNLRIRDFCHSSWQKHMSVKTFVFFQAV